MSSGVGNVRQLRLRLGLFVVLLLAVMSLLSMLPIREYIAIVQVWVHAHVLLGTVGLVLVFWVAVPLCLPATAFEMIAGSLFCLPHAVVIIIVGKTGGSTLAFLLGRALGNTMVGPSLGTRFPAFQAFANVLTSPSWKPVLLYQLSSLPNLVKVYTLAMTQVSVARFMVSSAVGTAPHAVLWAYLGGQATDLAAVVTGETRVSYSQVLVVATGFVLTIGALTYLGLYTKRQLADLRKRERRRSEEGVVLVIEDRPLLASPCSKR